MITQLTLPHWSTILIALHGIREKERYSQTLLRKVPIASSHVRNILILMETNGFIARAKEKEGRIRPITLTLKGEQIAEDVIKLRQDMERTPSFFENNESLIHNRLC